MSLWELPSLRSEEKVSGCKIAFWNFGCDCYRSTLRIHPTTLRLLLEFAIIALLASRGYFGGCIPHKLEETLSTADGRAIALRAIDSVKAALEAGPALLDHGTLNLLGFYEGNFVRGVETSRLIEVANAFKDLIAGRIECDVTSTAFMPGSHVAT